MLASVAPAAASVARAAAAAIFKKMEGEKMAGYNKIIVVGNLTRDVELKHTTSGKTVCNLGLAINTGFGDKKETLFIDATVWDKQAESCATYLKKGSAVLIEGRLVSESWEKDGEKKEKVKIVAQSVQFMSGWKGSEKTQEENNVTDDIPF